MKRLLGSLITLAITAAPIAAIVSCGNDTNNEVPVAKGDLSFKIINDSKDINENVVARIKNNMRAYIDEYAEGLAVKDIHIFDGNNSPHSTWEGSYEPTSNEIMINTVDLHDYKSFDNSDKANYIMQLIAHEYNHFVDHNYLLNIDPTSSKATQTIYTGDVTRVVQPWPSAFVDEFKNDLHYNAPTTKYPDVAIETQVDGSVAKSLGSVYDAKDIFDMSNSNKDGDSVFSKLNDDPKIYYVMAPENPVVETGRHRTIKGSSLRYIYSMDELFARKMQIATTDYHTSTHMKPNGFMNTGSNGEFETPYLQDVVNYQRTLHDTSTDGQYLADKPTPALADLYDKARGVGQTISFLENKNNKTIQSDGSFKGDIDRTQIRFGGTIKDGQQIGYMNGSDFAPIHITIQHSEEGKTFYLADFVKASDIKGKELYISSNGINTKITTTRDVKYGRVSTRRIGDTSSDINYAFDVNGILQTL